MKRTLKSAISGECADELREPRRPFDTSLFRGLLLAVRFAVSIGLILWAFRKIGLNNLIQTWSAISIGELAVAALAVVVLQCVSAVRWWVVARFTGVHFTLLQAIGAYFVGMVFNQVLPCSSAYGSGRKHTAMPSTTSCASWVAAMTGAGPVLRWTRATPKQS